MGKLHELRKKIDLIDVDIVKLLLLRFRLAKSIGKYKKSMKVKITDKKRELQIIKNIKIAKDNKNQKFIAGLFKKIIKHSKNLQK